jgi:hypothetical protein
LNEPMYLVKSSNRGSNWNRLTIGLPATLYNLQVGGEGTAEAFMMFIKDMFSC